MNGKIAFSSFGHTEKNENNVIVGIVDRVLIFPHELAHLFGVCDEYLFSYWEKQNEDLLLNTNELMGCANPFPNQCLDRIDEKCEGNILPIPYVKGYIDKILGIEGIDFGENICDKNSQVQYSMMGHHGFEHLGSMEMTVISECGFEECSRCSVGNNIEDCIDQTSKVCEKLWT